MVNLSDESDYPSCHVLLVDALREYIRTNHKLGLDLLREDSITEEQYQHSEKALDRCRALLHEIEDFEFNPSLCGVIKRKSV